jgi:hypothetical protein
MVNVILKDGSVFLSKDLATCGGNPHFHIVVHKTPDNQIVVVYTTKEVEKTRSICQRNEEIKFPTIDPDTLVLLDNTHSDSFTLPSAIDCSKAVLKPESYFTSQQYFKITQPIKDSATLDMIKKGIKVSDLIGDVIKKLL